jgi:hypothetical protein
MMHFVHVILLNVFWFYLILFVIAPIILRVRFRYRAKVEPVELSAEEMPEAARAYIEPRIAEFGNWNFERIAYLKFEDLAPSVQSYVALLANLHTAEWAEVTFIVSPTKKFGCMQFATRCSEQMQIDTNTLPSARILFTIPEHPTFRLPQVDSVFTLYRAHRMLVTEIAHGALPVIPPKGEEIAELKRRYDRVGPWQEQNGYMYLDATGENYRLTWKGAIVAAWRSIWPISALRAWRQRVKSRAILDRLGAAA